VIGGVGGTLDWLPPPLLIKKPILFTYKISKKKRECI